MLWFGCITPILTSTFTLPSSVSIFSPLMRTPVVEFTTWPKSKTTSSQDTELITSTRTLLSSKVTLWDCRRTWIFGEGGWEQCSTHYSYIKVRYNSLLPLLLSFFFFFSLKMRWWPLFYPMTQTWQETTADGGKSVNVHCGYNSPFIESKA